MKTQVPEVTVEVLQAFADAWNRHDVDALMSFMTDDCAFESSAGAHVCGTRYIGRERPCERASPRSGQSIPMPTGGTRATSSMKIAESRSGPSPEHARTERASKFRVAICSLRDGKIHLKNSYRKNRPPVAQR